MKNRKTADTIKEKCVACLESLPDEEITEVMEIWDGLLNDREQTIINIARKYPRFAAQLAEILARYC